MTEPEWTSIGIVGVLSLLLLREVLGFLKTTGRTGSAVADQAKAAAALEAELRKLSHAIANLTQILHALSHEMKATQQEVRECRKDIEDIQRRLK